MKMRPGSEKDRDAIRRLLEDSKLPTDDLDALAPSAFIVAGEAAAVTACVAAEIFDDVALLRSLVVSSEERGAGIGRRMVEALESDLASRGIREVWLLTIDADRWFATRGYRSAQRNEAPEAIRRTREFADLCPATAVLMTKSLD